MCKVCFHINPCSPSESLFQVGFISQALEQPGEYHILSVMVAAGVVVFCHYSHLLIDDIVCIFSEHVGSSERTQEASDTMCNLTFWEEVFADLKGDWGSGCLLEGDRGIPPRYPVNLVSGNLRSSPQRVGCWPDMYSTMQAAQYTGSCDRGVNIWLEYLNVCCWCEGNRTPMETESWTTTAEQM